MPDLAVCFIPGIRKDLSKGHLPGLLPAVNGLTDTTRIKEIIRKHDDGKGPFMVAEWYPALFDWCYEGPSKTAKGSFQISF